ncbi:hypothetical protein [Magnetospira sp. QH-2]|uniref:Bbp19 family protein n=1 Tax=Magnetospira sp. (strain QH-2) TaxID=1288970 RepID=UPI0003E814AE|nr:hypothetical protein [Magnetospira sp. QH-2]CCQ72345.1 conserved protein of unknown function [Magnetospira sp. QH-2]
MEPDQDGWNWFSAAPDRKSRRQQAALQQDLALACARCFTSRDGQRVLAHLKAITIDRPLGPGVDAATLRHMEGQRHLVAYLQTLVQRGQQGEGQ